jgi:hypothetical protein
MDIGWYTGHGTGGGGSKPKVDRGGYWRSNSVYCYYLNERGDVACAKVHRPTDGLLVMSLVAATNRKQVTRPKTDWVLGRVFQVHGAAINDCLRHVFGADWERLGEVNVWNAPPVSAHHTAAAIGQYANPPGPRAGAPGNGVILIASELFYQNRPAAVMRTYVHELGNMLDLQLNPMSSPTLRGQFLNYGDENHQLDKDTGQQLEDCVFSRWPNL